LDAYATAVGAIGIGTAGLVTPTAVVVVVVKAYARVATYDLATETLLVVSAARHGYQTTYSQGDS
jgi:hypothetical protein